MRALARELMSAPERGAPIHAEHGFAKTGPCRLRRPTQPNLS